MDHGDITQELGALVRSSPRDSGPVHKLFGRFDLDDSGHITVEELQEVLESWGDPISGDEAASLMKEIDTNRDGLIDYEEFRQFMLNLSSFDKHQAQAEFQSAYETWTRAMHQSLGISTHDPETPQDHTAKVLRRGTMNPCVRKMQYAVRGELLMTAERIAQELRGGATKEFDEVLFCNIGNPHSVGARPVTFYREVLALVDCPTLLDHPEVGRMFAPDAVARARALTAQVPGGTGAYSHSQGLLSIRKDVADFIEQRDGHPAFPDDIFLTNGASAAITMTMQILFADPSDAILIPIPQYPIYSALIEMLDAKAVGYYLDEASGWSLDPAELERSITDARKRGLNPKAMVIINPGNPTGQTMSEEELTEVVQFCRRNGLVLIADEVYQRNVYGPDHPFVSAKKVVRDLGPEFEGFELVSMHSTSKGLIGECGRRGGYMELCGILPEVKAELFKLACVGLCPNLDGQLMVHLMVRPPRPGDASYERFQAECEATFEGLSRKAERVVDSFNKLEGVTCQPVEGAMYAFPRIDLPEAALAAAERDGKSPDMHYCLSLLEHAGICTVPGSGFGQKHGTFHLRMSFLPSEDRLIPALERFSRHHASYMAQYAA